MLKQVQGIPRVLIRLGLSGLLRMTLVMGGISHGGSWQPPSWTDVMTAFPGHTGTWKGAWRRGTASLKLPQEPGIPERCFVLTSDYNWVPKDITISSPWCFLNSSLLEELRNLSLK